MLKPLILRRYATLLLREYETLLLSMKLYYSPIVTFVENVYFTGTVVLLTKEKHHES